MFYTKNFATGYPTITLKSQNPLAAFARLIKILAVMFRILNNARLAWFSSPLRQESGPNNMHRNDVPSLGFKPEVKDVPKNNYSE